MMRAEWLSLLPMLSLAGGGLSIFTLGAVRPKPTALPLLVAALACLISGGAALFSSADPVEVSGLVRLDHFSRFYSGLFAAIALLTLLFAARHGTERSFIRNDEFPGITLMATLGMTLMASSIHWLAFFLGLSLMSLSLYILIAIRRGDPLGLEAGLKYFIMSATASASVVFGIAMLHAAGGSLEIMESLTLAAHPENRPLLLFGAALLLVGLGFKLSLVPFHLWTPDVYQGAPAPVTGLLATGGKLSVIALLIRLAGDGGSAATLLAPALWAMAALTMVVGALTALAQTSLKRLLAYSSMTHMGYLLLALLAVKGQGAEAALFYSVAYAAMDLAAFGGVALLSPEGTDRDAITDYQGCGYTEPRRAAFLTLALFSLAGLPATAGFIGKFLIFRAAFDAGFVVLALIGILTAIVSLAFYLKVVLTLYRPAPGNLPGHPAKAGAAATIAALLAAAAILWLGIFPAALLTLP